MNFIHQHFIPSYGSAHINCQLSTFSEICHPLLHSPKEAKIKNYRKVCGHGKIFVSLYQQLRMASSLVFGLLSTLDFVLYFYTAVFDMLSISIAVPMSGITGQALPVLWLILCVSLARATLAATSLATAITS